MTRLSSIPVPSNDPMQHNPLLVAFRDEQFYREARGIELARAAALWLINLQEFAAVYAEGQFHDLTSIDSDWLDLEDRYPGRVDLAQPDAERVINRWLDVHDAVTGGQLVAHQREETVGAFIYQAWAVLTKLYRAIAAERDPLSYTPSDQRRLGDAALRLWGLAHTHSPATGRTTRNIAAIMELSRINGIRDRLARTQSE